MIIPRKIFIVLACFIIRKCLPIPFSVELHPSDQNRREEYTVELRVTTDKSALKAFHNVKIVSSLQDLSLNFIDICEYFLPFSNYSTPIESVQSHSRWRSDIDVCVSRLNNLYWLSSKFAFKRFKVINSNRQFYQFDILNIHDRLEWKDAVHKVCRLLMQSDDENVMASCSENLLEEYRRQVDTLCNPFILEPVSQQEKLSMPEIIPKEILHGQPTIINEFELCYRLYESGFLYYKNLGVHSSYFEENSPWPHVVLDDLIPSDFLRNVVNEVLQMQDSVLDENAYPTQSRSWRIFTDKNQHKMGTSDPLLMGPYTRALIEELKSFRFIQFLESITGEIGLIPDPWDIGGGVHMIAPGGFLKAHTDFPFHSKLKLWRRINLLLYLNENWLEEWGGELQMWSVTGEKPPKKLLPAFNRMVIFRTDNKSLHGHPESLRSPNNVYRKSIALYYYVSDITPSIDIATSTTNFTDIIPSFSKYVSIGN